MEGKKILYLGNKLHKKGANPTFIDTLSVQLENENYTLYTFSAQKNKLFRLAEMLFAIFKHRKKIDTALIDTYSTTAFWFAYISAKVLSYFKIPYITILHGGDLPLRFQSNQKEVLWLLNHAKTNVSPSDYLYQFFEKQNIKHLVKIPNFINIDDYSFKQRNNPEPKILWVRAFAEIYNPILALKTFEIIRLKYPKAKLSMVGPIKDNSIQTCKHYVEKHNLPVSFTGKLTRKEWTAFAKDFDFFINTTNIDNTPVSVIEAMAMGMLVVSTNVGGIPYLLKTKDDAILVEPNNAQQMAKAIFDLLDNSDLSLNISTNARMKAEQFDWKTIKKKWFEVL